MNEHEGCMPPQASQTPYGLMVTPAIHTPECLLKTWALNERTPHEMA